MVVVVVLLPGNVTTPNEPTANAAKKFEHFCRAGCGINRVVCDRENSLEEVHSSSSSSLRTFTDSRRRIGKLPLDGMGL